jgi:hypothetical protein
MIHIAVAIRPWKYYNAKLHISIFYKLVDIVSLAKTALPAPAKLKLSG